VRSPLEVHALSSGDDGDSTMGCLGCLAAGTFTSGHELANTTKGLPLQWTACCHRMGMHRLPQGKLPL
jgi:hypothetical protein